MVDIWSISRGYVFYVEDTKAWYIVGLQFGVVF